MIARTALVATFLLLCSVWSVAASLSYDIRDVKLTVSSFDGSSRLRKSFDSKASLPATPEVLTLDADDVIKLSFSTVLSNGEKATGDFLPHQAWVVIGDADPTLSSDSVWPLRVRGASASATWSLRVDRMGESLKKAIVKGMDHPLRVYLVLASFSSSSSRVVEPLQLPLLDLQFSSAIVSRIASTPSVSQRSKAEREDGFLPWPANQHTFQKEPWQSMPPKMVSLIAALVVLGLPWATLLTIVRFYD